MWSLIAFAQSAYQRALKWLDTLEPKDEDNEERW